ncbi:MAG: electron transport complex subunit RsxC [Gammaproteobacteria bacterium]|nr:electron transport complex subunit RsxC [Gammaproteobacteria bacterium]MCI0590846.1 electron transport complex subunit RsxC [Gammaproteobacteria bacterium]
MSQTLWQFHGGLKLPGHKALSNREPSIPAAIPERLFLPLQQHIGIASRPTVKIGEKVLKGQLIASAEGYVSVPVHASTSGTVIDIGDYPVAHPSDVDARCIVIEPDGDDVWVERRVPAQCDLLGPKAVNDMIRDAGIVGLGGAGFPSHVKVNEGVENVVDTLIINGAECEPYITCDDRLIRERADEVIAGASLISRTVQAKRCIVAVEDDMRDAYAALEKVLIGDIELAKVPAIYPAGGEKQLIFTLTGKEVPCGRLPIHIGIVMHNVATAAAVYRVVHYGEPLVSRYVTVTGSVVSPRNMQVLLGTPVGDLVDQCGRPDGPPKKVIMGGPMMGIPVQDERVPVIKTTNCILVTDALERGPQMPCIRCGDCVDVCPVNLLPQQLYWYARAQDFDTAQDLHLFDCIDCGCCAQVCPSNIPLVQYFFFAKSEIAAEEEARGSADRARGAYESRTARLAKDEAERARHLQQGDIGESRAKNDRGQKKAYIQAAIERTKAKRATAREREGSPKDNATVGPDRKSTPESNE